MSNFYSDKFSTHRVSSSNSPIYGSFTESKHSHLSSTADNRSTSPFHSKRFSANHTFSEAPNPISSRNSDALSLEFELERSASPRFELEPHLLLPDDHPLSRVSVESQEDQETFIEGSSPPEDQKETTSQSLQGIKMSSDQFSISSLASDISALSIHKDPEKVASAKQKRSFPLWNNSQRTLNSPQPFSSNVSPRNLASINSRSTINYSDLSASTLNDSSSHRGRHFRSVSHSFGNSDSFQTEYADRNNLYNNSYCNSRQPLLPRNLTNSPSLRRRSLSNYTSFGNQSRRDEFAIPFNDTLNTPKHIQLLEKGYNHYLDFALSDSEYLYSSIKSVVSHTLEINRQLRHLLASDPAEFNDHAVENILQINDNQIRCLTEYLLEASVVPQSPNLPNGVSNSKYSGDQINDDYPNFQAQENSRHTPSFLDRKINHSHYLRDEMLSSNIGRSNSERINTSFGSNFSRNSSGSSSSHFNLARRTPSHRPSASVQAFRSDTSHLSSENISRYLTSDQISRRPVSSDFRQTPKNTYSERRNLSNLHSMSNWSSDVRDEVNDSDFRFQNQGYLASQSLVYRPTSPLDTNYRASGSKRYSFQQA